MEWLRNDEAAKIIGVTPNTLRCWVSRKLVPHYKVGGKVLFSRADLDEYLKQRRVEAA